MQLKKKLREDRSPEKWRRRREGRNGGGATSTAFTSYDSSSSFSLACSQRRKERQKC